MKTDRVTFINMPQNNPNVNGKWTYTDEINKRAVELYLVKTDPIR